MECDAEREQGTAAVTPAPLEAPAENAPPEAHEALAQATGSEAASALNFSPAPASEVQEDPGQQPLHEEVAVAAVVTPESASAAQVHSSDDSDPSTATDTPDSQGTATADPVGGAASSTASEPELEDPGMASLNAMALAVSRFRSSIKKARKKPSRGRIHDLRTAGRQLEPLSEMLQQFMPSAEAPDPLSVGRYVRRFSNIRALDVADRLVKSLAEDPETGLSESDPAIQDVRACLKKARAKLRGKVWRILNSPPKGLRAQLRFLEKQEFEDRLWAGCLVLQAQSLMRELQNALQDRSDPQQDETSLHRARLLGKGLRYTLELLPGLRAPALLNALLESQKRLGALRDWSYLEDLVTDRRQEVLGKRKKADLRPALAGLEAVVRTRVEQAFQSAGPALWNLLHELNVIRGTTASETHEPSDQEFVAEAEGDGSTSDLDPASADEAGTLEATAEAPPPAPSASSTEPSE